MRCFQRSFTSIVLLCLTCTICVVRGRPAEEPTKFTLGTANDSKIDASVDASTPLQRGKELLGRVGDAIRIGRGRFVNYVTLARNIVADQAEQLVASEAQNNVATIRQSRLSVEPTHYVPMNEAKTPVREVARLESEDQQALLERPISAVQKSLGSALEGFLRPTPIVDGLREEDKYGNNGDKFMGISRALVNGFEGFSNFVNTVIDLPKNAAKRTSQGITTALNQIGARLVGLQ